jgi:hypothetical protein
MFDPKNLRNTIGTLLNQLMTSRNAKNRSETQNQPRIINHFEFRYVF